jgi:pseudouridine-5'-monophosphatase
MQLARSPKAAIFDLDGVLLDTEPLYTEATQAIVARYGKTFDWELKRRTMGGDAHLGAKLVIEALGLPLTIEEYLGERVRRLRELFVTVPAMPGAEQWIETLSSLGLEIAVGTSSVRELCDIKWARHPWLAELPFKVCGNDPAVRHRKPEPDIFLAAAALLGMKVEDCVVFEDSPAGVEAARRAGMQVIAIKAPQLDPIHLAHADIIVNGYAELSPSTLLL